MKSVVTVIYEINCGRSDPSDGSIWVAKGDTAADDEGPYPQGNPDALKFCGPVDRETAKETERRVKALLEFLGYDVRTETVVDD